MQIKCLSKKREIPMEYKENDNGSHRIKSISLKLMQRLGILLNKNLLLTANYKTGRCNYTADYHTIKKYISLRVFPRLLLMDYIVLEF